jgi:hypothetical protein
MQIRPAFTSLKVMINRYAVKKMKNKKYHTVTTVPKSNRGKVIPQNMQVSNYRFLCTTGINFISIRVLLVKN